VIRLGRSNLATKIDANLIPSLTQMEAKPSVQRVPVEVWVDIFSIILFDPLLFDLHSPIRWTFRHCNLHYCKLRRANLSQQRCHLMLVCKLWYHVAYGLLRIYVQDWDREQSASPSPYPIHTVDRLYNNREASIERVISSAFQSVQSLTCEMCTTNTVPGFLEAVAQLPLLRALQITGSWPSPVRLSTIQRLFPRLVALSIMLTGDLLPEEDVERFEMDHLETFEYVMSYSTLPFHSTKQWTLPALRHVVSCASNSLQRSAVTEFLQVFGPQVESLGLHMPSQTLVYLPANLWELTPNLRVVNIWGNVQLEPPLPSCPLEIIYSEPRHLFRTFSSESWRSALQDRVKMRIQTTFKYTVNVPDPFVTQEESQSLKTMAEWELKYWILMEDH
jgi:hypothetical protein